MHLAYLVYCLSGVAHAAVSVTDPSDVISPQLWAADNAIVPNYSVPFISVQPSPIIATYNFNGNSTSVDHETFSTTLNQTTVILVADGAELNLSYVDVVKAGYASNLLESSFYGFNAAINVVSAVPCFGPTKTHISLGKRVHRILRPYQRYNSQRCCERLRLWNRQRRVCRQRVALQLWTCRPWSVRLWKWYGICL
jgi:hypothetical protein